jgi:hypothetical protein
MKKINFFLFLTLLFTIAVKAQESRGGKPYSFLYPLNDHAEAARKTMARLDVPALRKAAHAAVHKGEMMPAGKILPTDFSLDNSGVWTVLPNKDRVWRLFLSVPDAPATSLYYENFYLPEGAVLYVYNAEKTHLIGSFGTHNNHESGQFATEIIYTSDCVLEYYEPANVKRPGRFTITGVANVYNAPEPPAYIKLKDSKCCGFGTSGSCNVNANCPEGNSWADQKRAVARILVKNGLNQGYCSGSLINNGAQDCKNYFLTANHCGAAVSAADKNQWIFYFNYQSAGCTNGASEPTSSTMTGCTMRSSNSNGTNSDVTGSDFLLVEFNSAIPAAYNVYYAGWNASGTGSNSGVSIHHPSGDIKKISTYTSALTSRRYYSQLPDNSHWQADWVATVTNHSITEGGSSGSPLFNSSGLIVGKLSGGPSSCGAAASSKNDYYGKLSYDWTSNGTTAATQLKPWLDPANSGITSLTGKNACGVVAGCPDIQEPNNTQATAGTIALATSYKALIANSTDLDFYKFTTTGSSNITVSLTTLPFDYDVQLLNSAGTVLASGTSSGTTSENVVLNNAAAGTYTVRVFGYNGAFSATSCYTLSVSAVTACTNTPEPNESLAAASLMTANTTLRSQIASSTDADWYRFSNTAAQPNIKVTLATLPGDYDLFLYNSAGTLLTSSESGSTTSESLVLNGGAVGTYYIRVVGYNGAFSTTTCYTLTNIISATTQVKSTELPITRVDKGKAVSIFPNPANDQLTVGFSATADEAGVQPVVITDLSGRRIWNRNSLVNEGYNQLGIRLPAGMGSGLYLLSVGRRAPVKFVKEK